MIRISSPSRRRSHSAWSCSALAAMNSRLTAERESPTDSAISGSTLASHGCWRSCSAEFRPATIDGIRFAGHHVMVALGVEPTGKKHLLGVREGATENATVVTELLADLVARGLDPKQRRLFVIDGSKALRAAIERVFGGRVPVQRCRTHKLRNVREHLPRHLQAQVTSAMRAAFRLPPQEGIAKLKQQASWL